VATTRLAAGNSQLLRQTVSTSGRPVQLLLEQGAYTGAQPYFTVAMLKASGRPSMIRHTPLLARAETLFELMARDVTDPAGLR
jgi:hypothetical protein